MFNFKHINWLSMPLLALTITACSQTTPPTTTATNNTVGDYVNAGYADREKGHDWVSVSLSESQPDQIAISVRARGDLKKPTCTFDGYAQKTSPNTYHMTVNKQPITLTLTPTQLRITPQSREGESVLAYFCSGGATFAGSYDKLNGPLDRSQIKSDTLESNP